jgi:preprotein translocase YajC subunit
MVDSLFLFLGLAFLGVMLFYSNNKRKKLAKTLEAQVVKGAYVMLTSGIYGKITAVLENRIESETAPGQKLLVATGAVRSVEEEPKKSKPASSAAKPATKSAPKTKSRSAAKSPAKSLAKKK